MTNTRQTRPLVPVLVAIYIAWGFGYETVVAGATDADLPRSMPVGTKIKKLSWHLSYERDGKPVDDFPAAFYSGAMGLAISFLIWGILLWRGSPSSTADRSR